MKIVTGSKKCFVCYKFEILIVSWVRVPQRPILTTAKIDSSAPL